MGITSNMQSIIHRQKMLLGELEAEYAAIESSEFTKENDLLKAALEKTNAEYLLACEKLAQNTWLKNSSLRT